MWTAGTAASLFRRADREAHAGLQDGRGGRADTAGGGAADGVEWSYDRTPRSPRNRALLLYLHRSDLEQRHRPRIGKTDGRNPGVPIPHFGGAVTASIRSRKVEHPAGVKPRQ